MTPDPGDFAVGPDQHRGAKNPEEGPAIHGFIAPGAVGLEHLMFFVRNQRNDELMLVAKAFLRAEGISGDAKNLGSGFGEGTLEPCEVDRLSGATGSICARVEEQYQFLAGKIGKRDHAATIPW